jgi:glycerol uptake facilitator protein
MHVDAAVLGEFVGTMVLILLGNGVVGGVVLTGTKAENAGWIVITTGWGLAVFCGIATAIALGDSDAHLNPAFTVAAVLMNGRPERLVTYIPAQMLGAICGATLVWLFYRPHFAITEDRVLKLACFATHPSIRRYGYNFFCELIGTFILVLVASAFASHKLAANGVAPGLGPVLVGALVWSIGLSLGATTGYAINPARDLGPRIAHALLPIAGKGGSDWGYGWVPVLGPVAGAALAAAFVLATGM